MPVSIVNLRKRTIESKMPRKKRKARQPENWYISLHLNHLDQWNIELIVKVLSAVNNGISFVESALFKLRAGKNLSSRQAKKQKKELAKALKFQNPIPSSLPPEAVEFLKATSGDEEDGFGAPAKELDEMANAIGPIMNNFDEVLVGIPTLPPI